ncbi:MAG: enoyl-CoA hydratase-related protein [Candidatus Palauibacterales bacterium]|nr:enoyl-CoA hydratase-related protein [Candidatus Palauibacterales bacterium]MDP2482190.1 enoyl-CoA hydratase-related protein [Candidatus Palauibacterales bacterium]
MISQLLHETDGKAGIATITLNRPERRNALNRALVEELKESLTRAGEDERLRVVAVRGSGPDFCAGADLRELQEAVQAGPEASLEDAQALGDLFLLIRRLEKPVVALVHGRALAGGAGLATACDLVLAAADAQFGYPEVQLGFVPAMVMAILRRAVGEKRAFELITLGHSIDAETASRYGLVNRVFPAADFDRECEAFLADLGTRSASALALSKRLLYQIDGASFESAVRAGAQVNVIARLTEDCQEGVRRFLDRSSD